MLTTDASAGEQGACAGREAAADGQKAAAARWQATDAGQEATKDEQTAGGSGRNPTQQISLSLSTAASHAALVQHSQQVSVCWVGSKPFKT